MVFVPHSWIKKRVIAGLFYRLYPLPRSGLSLNFHHLLLQILGSFKGTTKILEGQASQNQISSLKSKFWWNQEVRKGLLVEWVELIDRHHLSLVSGKDRWGKSLASKTGGPRGYLKASVILPFSQPACSWLTLPLKEFVAASKFYQQTKVIRTTLWEFFELD